MEIRFTASVIEAIQFVLRLMKGKFWLSEGGLADSPVWCNFCFFSRIKASPIRRVERIKPTRERPGPASWKLERTIEFFCRESRVAVVDLIGQKFDGDDDGLDKGSFWAVTRVGYFRSFSGKLSDSPKDWREIEFKVTYLNGRLVA